MRFYVKPMGAVCYDRTGVTFPYRGGEYLCTDYVESMGGTDATWERQYGWSNQPEVLCFNASPQVARNIDGTLPVGLLVSEHWQEA